MEPTQWQSRKRRQKAFYYDMELGTCFVREDSLKRWEEEK